MSTSTDPQTWVFPPLGAKAPPAADAAAFGPVANSDKIVLVWTPASEEPDVNMICTNDSQTYPIISGKTSPYTYTFDQTLGGGNSDQDFFCHFFFANTEVGNTIPFEYSNTPEDQAITWQQNDQLQSALDAATASQSAAATVTQTVTAGTLLTTVSDPSTTFVATATGVSALPQTDSSSNSNSSSGLSTGGAAGIGVAAAIIFCGGLLVGYLIWRQSRKNRRQAPIPTPQHASGSKAPPMQQTNVYTSAGGSNARPPYPQQQGAQRVHEVQG